MATVKLNIVEENTAPPIVLTLERDGTVIDVTGCTVSLIITFNGAITNTGHQTCVLTTPTSGVVTYTPQTNDFANPGTYKCDIKVVYGDASIERLYDILKIKARAKSG